MSITEIKNMSASERLETMEMLWDVMCHEEDEIQSPEWHEDILNQRRKRIESGEANFLTIDQLKEKFCN